MHSQSKTSPRLVIDDQLANDPAAKETKKKSKKAKDETAPAPAKKSSQKAQENEIHDASAKKEKSK